MKLIVTSCICAASALLLAQPVFAQSAGQGARQETQTGNQSQRAHHGWSHNRMQSGSQNQQALNTKEVLGQEVKNQQGENLGTLQNIIINTQNDKDFALIDVGQSRLAPVPIQALNVTSSTSGKAEVQVKTQVTKQELQSWPTIAANQESELNNPSFTQQVYSHFNVRPNPLSVGGGEGTSSSGSSTGSGENK